MREVTKNSLPLSLLQIDITNAVSTSFGSILAELND